MKEYSQNAISITELDDLHVLVGVVDHGEIADPRQPRRDVGGEVPSEQLSSQSVECADSDRHLHIHTARTHKETHTLWK